jgi:spoIIIJ-associated protein
MEKEFTGKTVADALRRAAAQLQLQPEDIRYTVIRPESRRLFGLLGGQPALISVTVPEREGRDIVKDLIDTAFADHLQEQEPEVGAATNRQQKVETPPVATTAVVSAAKVQGQEQRVSASSAEVTASSSAVSASASNPAATVDEDLEPSDYGDGEFDAARVRETVAGILRRMGVEYRDIILRHQEQDLFIEVVETGEPPLLTSRNGQVLDAVQYLLNKLHGVRGGRIHFDSGDYRSRHEEHIRKLAEKIANRVKRTRKPASINALNAHDRRIVHLAIQQDGDLRSRSKGEGDYKKIVIYPKGSPRRGGSGRNRERQPSAAAQTDA